LIVPVAIAPPFTDEASFAERSFIGFRLLVALRFAAVFVVFFIIWPPCDSGIVQIECQREPVA
jgi:hypothetical protein